MSLASHIFGLRSGAACLGRTWVAFLRGYDDRKVVVASLDGNVLLGCVWRHVLEELLTINEEIVLEEFS